MRIGLRTIKTCIAVWICAMTIIVIWLIAKSVAPNYEGTGWTWTMVNNRIYNPFFAGLATVYSLQQNKKKSLTQARNRGLASIIGGLYGILVVLLFSVTIDKIIPSSEKSSLWEYSFWDESSYKMILNYTIKYILFAILAIGLIQFTVIIHQPDLTFISMLTYIAVVVSGQNWVYGIVRILSTLWGVVVALVVNFFFIPRYKNKKKLFVVGLDGFTYNDGAKLPGFETYKLNQLISFGAYVVFYTSRTTGSFAKLSPSLENNAPVMVMNGSGIYDYHLEKYLYNTNIDVELKLKLIEVFDKYKVNHFENVIKNDILFIYSPLGELNEGEEIYAKMRKNAAYTNYVYGNTKREKEATYMVLVNENFILKQIMNEIKDTMGDEVSMYMYDFVGVVGYSFLKIYNNKVKKMESLEFLKDYYKLDSVIALGCNGVDDDLFSIADKSYKCETSELYNRSKRYQVRYKKSVEREFKKFASEYNKK